MLHNLIIDGVEKGNNITDGDINTKEEFKSTFENTHTLVFSESNNKDFEKIYIRQKGINQINIIIDDTQKYYCKFDFSTCIDENSIIEIDFKKSICVLTKIEIELYSNESDFYIFDMWFDYYINKT